MADDVTPEPVNLTCSNCATPLRRRSDESPSAYAIRRYCSTLCVGLARQRRWADPAGPPWTSAESGCWTWDRDLTTRGYGWMPVGGGIKVPAHVWVYEQEVGPVPDGLELDHTCRNHSCVNPAHLEPVTHAENVRRGRRAKLTADEVGAIRQSRETGVALAAAFGVSTTTISRVRLGRTWQEAA